MKRAIRHFEKCSCNPDNGGSGLCGCVIGQQIVGYEEIFTTYSPNLIIRAETCPICQKILTTSEDLYWHLRQHKEGLLTPSPERKEE